MNKYYTAVAEFACLLIYVTFGVEMFDIMQISIKQQHTTTTTITSIQKKSITLQFLTTTWKNKALSFY